MSLKETLLAQLASIQAQLANCDCDHNENTPVFNAGRNDDNFTLRHNGDEYEVEEDSGSCDLSYRTQENAEAHAKAFNLFHLLRVQPGVVPLKHGTWQYLIEAKMSGSNANDVRLEIRKRRDASVKMTRCFSPAFETEQAAQKAINVIGADSILAAMKTLAWG